MIGQPDPANLTPEQAKRIYDAYIEVLESPAHGTGLHDALHIVLIKNGAPLPPHYHMVMEHTEDLLKSFWRAHPDQAPGAIPKAPRFKRMVGIFPEYE